jgi:hypothetical protein
MALLKAQQGSLQRTATAPALSRHAAGAAPVSALPTGWARDNQCREASLGWRSKSHELHACHAGMMGKMVADRSLQSSPRIFYGWFVVAGAFAVTFVGFGSAYTFSAFIASLQRDFAASRGRFRWSSRWPGSCISPWASPADRSPTVLAPGFLQ